MTAATTFRLVDQPDYNENIVAKFAFAAIAWGVVGLLVGDLIAWQLAFPGLNVHEWFSYGRLRPLHTSAVAFALGGNFLMCASLYVVQRTCRCGLWGGRATADLLFWGYQAFIVMAAVSYVLGATQGREYAEPEWLVDLYLALIWVLYIVIFVGTITKRREPHIYVANWYFLAFMIAVAMLHIVNNLAVPVSFFGIKSYSLFSGVQDAMTQWWYGHNVVGFFLTAGFLGAMYYFVPVRAERPIYSYRLSVVNFWGLVFFYIWAGPHHLHYTALPDWAQTLGMVFSIMLWMPSWGSMINGVMTLSGAWSKLRTDPVIRFMVVAIAFYGMSTFEGPLMAIKEVNALSHYTDWTVGHVHSGALGWVALIAFGCLYHLVPKLCKKPLYSNALVEWHFWIATVGIVLYVVSMWMSGITQGLMWRAYDEFGFLQYSFSETVTMLHPYYVIRAVGGLFFVLGGVIMAYNFLMTWLQKDVADQAPASAQAAPAE